MAFCVVDTDTPCAVVRQASCTCCRYLEGERVKLTGAVDHLLKHYNGEQLMDGTFDHVVVRSEGADVKASEALRSVGWSQELERKHAAALAWKPKRIYVLGLLVVA